MSSSLLLGLGFILLPLFFWPWAQIPHELPKVTFVIWWVRLLVVIGVFEFYSMRRKRIGTRFLLLILLFLVWIIITSLLGFDFYKSLIGNYFRQDGIFTLVHLVALAIYIALFNQNKWKKIIPASISIGSLITSIWVIILGIRLYIFSDISVPNWSGAIGASFGQPKFATGYLLVSLPFIYYCYRVSIGHKIKLFWIIAFFSIVVAILLTKSYAGILGLGFFSIFQLVLRLQKIKQKIGCILIIFIAFFLVAIAIEQFRFEGFVAGSRNRIVTKLLLGASRRPWFGYGYANVDYAFEAVDYPMYFAHDIYLDKAHSTILEVLVTTGIIGLLLYLGIIIAAGSKLLTYAKKDKLYGNTLLLALMLFIFHSQTNVISISEEVLFWIIAGLAMSFM